MSIDNSPCTLEDGWQWKHHAGRGWCEVEKKTNLEIEYAFAVVRDDGTMHTHGIIPTSVMLALLAQCVPGSLTRHAMRHGDAALRMALTSIASAIYGEQIHADDVGFGPGGSLDVGGRDVRCIAEDAGRAVLAFAEKWLAYTKLHSHVHGTMIDAESSASFEHRNTARHLDYKQWLDEQFMLAARGERTLP